MRPHHKGSPFGFGQHRLHFAINEHAVFINKREAPIRGIIAVERDQGSVFELVTTAI